MTRRRRRSGWLAWWCEPWPGPRRSRSRSRSSSTWGPGSLSWWLARPGSTPPARYGRITDPPRERVRGSAGTCPICGKGAGCRCRMVRGEPIKRRRRPAGAAPYAYPPDFRAQNAIWCGNCRRRINTYTGHCTNTKCPR